MTTRSSRRRNTAPRTGSTNRPQAAGQERPAWRDPNRMLGAMLANAGSRLAVATLLFLAQHVEVTWHWHLGTGPLPARGSGADRSLQNACAGNAALDQGVSPAQSQRDGSTGRGS